jgi:DNA-binding response OmpR family regulator
MIRLVMNDNATSQRGGPAGAQLQRPTTPPQRILVVDDDRDVRRMSAHALIGSGYHADTAEDGAAAWEALQIKAFNLLITNHNMPKLTGVELVRKLRSARMALPVILATGKLPAEALAQNPSLQLAALLPKPFSIDELLETVRTVLRATDHAPGSLEPLPDSRSQPSADGLQV